MSADKRLASKIKGPIAWMARNPVAANLMMGICFTAGAAGLLSIKQEVFPEFSLDMINVTMVYPGASPADVEQGIVFAIEEAVRGLDGVKRVNSVAAENVANVNIELLIGTDADKVVADVKNAVDRITSFPDEAEEPVVAVASRRSEVVSLVISGEQDLGTLHGIAEKVRADLLTHDDITQVEIGGVPPVEVSIEISRERLESYKLTIEHVARQIRAASVEMPGGEIETTGGEILVRIADRRRRGHEFADVILRGTEKGYEVRLGDIATIRDGYADTDQASFFDGRPAVRVTAYRVGDETPTEVAAAVREYATHLQAELPSTVHTAIWADDSQVLEARIDLLSRNARMGLVLVIIILAMFLKPRLAAWVALGIPISFFGALAILPATDVSINMVTTFAFIVTLGLVVDDAIVVGENVFSKLEEGLPPLQAAIEGAREMAVPVTFSVLTTLAAFSPLLMVPGTMGKIFRLIPTVVCAVLVISLFESFFILPAHLGHEKMRSSIEPFLRPLNAVQRSVSAWLAAATQSAYIPLVKLAIRFRYITAAIAIAIFTITIGAVASGLVPFSFFPKLEGDLVYASARLPYGVPIERTMQVRKALESSASKAIEQSGGRSIVRGMYTAVGSGPEQHGPTAGSRDSGSHMVTIAVNLVGSEEREVSSREFSAAWEKNTPPLSGLDSLVFVHASGPGAGAAVDVQLSHENMDTLAAASRDLTESLRGYTALTNVQNAHAAGKPQLDYHLTPHASMMGLTSADIGRQLRGAFFGIEALREQRGRNEVKVMVRLPASQRQSETDLEQLLIGTPHGGHVPLAYLAEFDRGRSPTAIKRESGRRIINVSGELAAGVVSPKEVLDSLDAEILPQLQAKFPGLTAELVGEQRSQGETFASLRKNFGLAVFVIFGLLAIPFKSYIQPFIVMSAIPFGFVGAVAGHALMGFELSLISMFGIIALSGVVVNDSLVLIDATNRERTKGTPPLEAIVRGASRRVRPILLTSLTTFFGLAPMILETSMQARFLVPMAISLGFGVMFATVIVLLLVPANYVIVEDVRDLFGIHDNYAADEPETPVEALPA